MNQDRLRELLHYDPFTGVFTRRVNRGRYKAGEVAGTVHHGYVIIGVCRVKYMAHRLAWLYVHGVWPKDEIDHINGMSNDNRIENLREATHIINAQNQRKAQRINKVGFLGVSPYFSKFLAQICANGKKHYLGAYSTPDLAHAAYVRAKRLLHPGGTL